MQLNDKVQHVYLVGAKSLGAYGGYETFVYKLTEYHQNKENIKYHVACKANGDGCMDESKFEGVTKINDHEFELHNAHCFKIDVPQIGPVQAIYYDVAALKTCCEHARNAKIRHTERNRTIEDLLNIVTEFINEFKAKFGEHVHVLDWALHLDESTPHIHERHVFDCKNKYGEVAPQQEKALEALGFELPDPDKPLSRRNNRKIAFDAACRKMLFEIAKRHGLELEEEAEYGNRKYLEKQDFILAKQKEQLAAQQNKLDELTLKVNDMETLIDEVSAAAYDKAVEVVTDVVCTETRKEDIYNSGNYKLAFSPAMQEMLQAHQQDFMQEDAQAGMIYAFLEDYTGERVCSKQLYAEALGNTNIPAEWETRAICEIMNTGISRGDIQGWQAHKTAKRYPKYGVQKGWERVTSPETGAEDFSEITDAEAKQLGFPF